MAAILDSRTLQSPPESVARADYDGHKRRRGSKAYATVDTLNHLLTLVVTPANEQNRNRSASWRLPCRRPPANMLDSPTSTKATPGGAWAEAGSGQAA